MSTNREKKLDDECKDIGYDYEDWGKGIEDTMILRDGPARSLIIENREEFEDEDDVPMGRRRGYWRWLFGGIIKIPQLLFLIVLSEVTEGLIGILLSFIGILFVYEYYNLVNVVIYHQGYWCVIGINLLIVGILMLTHSVYRSQSLG